MALSRFVESVVARLRETPVGFAELPPEAVPGSILTGGAGIAFFLHEVARLRGDESLLPLARRWNDAAAAWAQTATPSQWNAMSFGWVVGDAGIAYVDALLSAGEGDAARVVAAVARMERAAASLAGTARATEFLAGAAGVAQGARDLYARLPPAAPYHEARGTLARIRDSAVGLVLARYRAPFDVAPTAMLGFAHGIVGELWTLVSVLGAAQETVAARLADLAALRAIDAEGFVYWLPTLQSDATFLLGTWCNGMAGHLLLWSEVARQTGDSAWLELARRSSESAVILLNGSPTVCCGLAGHALALQRYAEVSGDKRVARLAYRRLVAAIEPAEQEGASAFLGLWQGTLGIALVALKRLHGEKSLPLLEPLFSTSSPA